MVCFELLGCDFVRQRLTDNADARERSFVSGGREADGGSVRSFADGSVVFASLPFARHLFLFFRSCCGQGNKFEEKYKDLLRVRIF